MRLASVAPDAFERMLERRVVFLRGPLDHDAAALATAQVLALDGDGAEAITLFVNSPGGSLDACFVAVDTLRLVSAPLVVRCIGQAAGTAAALLAAAPGRREATPHARLSVRLGSDASASGTYSDIARQAAEHEKQWEQLRDLLAAATDQPPQIISHDLQRGAAMSAAEAVAYGLIDDIATGVKST